MAMDDLKKAGSRTAARLTCTKSGRFHWTKQLNVQAAAGFSGIRNEIIAKSQHCRR
jgi:hypothetical protein